jgi:hypothetical protein
MWALIVVLGWIAMELIMAGLAATDGPITTLHLNSPPPKDP